MHFIIPDRVRTRGRLPHWERDDSIYFVTFILDDALPRHIASSLILEHEKLRAGATNPAIRDEIDRVFQLRFDGELDQARGSCALALPGSASIVEGALRYFDTERYTLHTFAVMPNHVHVLVHLDDGRRLARVTHSWKSYTANRINAVVGRTGALWRRESYDRIVRDEREYDATRRYILDNPRKAGLTDWPWVWP